MKTLLLLAAGTAGFLCHAGNLLPNSSFELGCAGWGIRTTIPKKDGHYRVIREKISFGNALHGNSILELPNPDGHAVQVCSVPEEGHGPGDEGGGVPDDPGCGLRSTEGVVATARTSDHEV